MKLYRPSFWMLLITNIFGSLLTSTTSEKTPRTWFVFRCFSHLLWSQWLRIRLLFEIELSVRMQLSTLRGLQGTSVDLPQRFSTRPCRVPNKEHKGEARLCCGPVSGFKMAKTVSRQYRIRPKWRLQWPYRAEAGSFNLVRSLQYDIYLGFL